MKNYIDLVKDILNNGERKRNRTGVDCLTTTSKIFEHDMSKGFPLLTNKFVSLRTISVELEGFIRGITDKQWFEDRKCFIWSDWCNPKKVPYGNDLETKKKMREEKDLGKIYGFNWRCFGSNSKKIVSVKTIDGVYENKIFPDSPTVCGVGYSDRNLPQNNQNPNEFENLIYKNWYDMIYRCYNPKSPQYKYYGKLGVKVCDEWLTYENYRKDIEKLPRWVEKLRNPKEFQLDKDYFKANYYSPDTCVFLSRAENIMYTGSKNYLVKSENTAQFFLTHSQIAEYLGFTRKSVSTYLDKDKTYVKGFETGDTEEYSISTISPEQGHVYRYDLPVDQLQLSINTLKDDPNSRRIIVTAWNPNEMDCTALPSCHVMFIFQHINGKLSLNWVQRSVDTFLGLPYNIASYGLLLELVAKEVGMVPHMLTGNLVDCHIYENHIDQCKELIARESHPLPKLQFKSYGDFWDWTHEDVKCLDYTHSGKLSAEVSV